MRNWATSLARRDAQAFWEKLADLLSNAEENGEARQWWRLIQRHLPKNKAKKDALCGDPCSLEAGSETFVVELYQEVAQEHQGKQAAAPRLEDLPSLLDLEQALRNTQARKVPGLDGMHP